MSHSATTEAIKLDNPPPDIAKTLRNTSNGAGRELALIQKSSSPLAENRWLQRLVFSASCVKGLDPTKLSHLARAHCVLVETNLRLRGIPSPGQLRPDLDPVQLKRAMKRARGRQPIEIAQMVNAAAGAAMMDAEEGEQVVSEPPEGNAVESKAPKPPTRKASMKRETPAETTTAKE